MLTKDASLLLSFSPLLILLLQNMVRAGKRRQTHTVECSLLSFYFSAELQVPDLPADVELHELKAAECICKKHRGGHRPRGQLKVCLPDGEHNERVPPWPQL